MIDPQTWLVAVAACVVIVAVWAWGIVREDAAVVRGYASGIELGRALERGAIVAGTRTAASGPQSHSFDQEGPSTGAGVLSRGSGPETGGKREIPTWLRGPGGSGERG